MYVRILTWLASFAIKQLSKRAILFESEEDFIKTTQSRDLRTQNKLIEALSRYANHQNWARTDYSCRDIGKYDYWVPDEDGWKIAEKALND